MRRSITSRCFRHLGVHSLGTCFAVFMGLGLASAVAAKPPQAAVYAIEQPSQEMAQGLQAIARQTNIAVVFDPEIVAGRVTRQVSGRLSPLEAINAALQGSGLRAEQMPNGVVVVKPAPPAGAVRTAPAQTPSTPGAAAGSTGALGIGDQLAALNDGEEPGPVRSNAVQELTRVEVTGSRLKRLDAEGPAPVNVYTRADIDKSGQPSLQRFLSSLTEVSASAGEGGFATTLGQGTVQLRGLPLGSTLVLINGRKVQGVGSSTGNVFNLNLIPMAAVERVEVVPLGSSAVYGGDALAGVVNVILKKTIDGQALAARVGSGRGFSDHSVSLATGAQSADAEFLLMASYSRSTPLNMNERAFFLDGDYRRFGGPDARLNYCVPGTVRSTSGNLPGLSSGVAAIPQPAAGQALKVSDFQATAGTQNLCNVWSSGGGIALVHGYEMLAVHALGEHRLGGNWWAFGELTHARDRMQAAGIALRLNGVTVPATNPFNPFGVAVTVTAGLDPVNGTEGLARQTDFTRALVGVRGDLGGGWDAEVSASTITDRGGSQSWNEAVNATARTAALASTDPATALNPFYAGRMASDSVLRRIWTDNLGCCRFDGHRPKLLELSRTLSG